MSQPASVQSSNPVSIPENIKVASPNTTSGSPVSESAVKTAADPNTVSADANTPASADLHGASPEDVKISSKFAALSRKERSLFAKQQELKQIEADIAKKQAAVDAEMSARKAQVDETYLAVQKFEEVKKMNPLKAMEALGFTYQQLTDMVLNEGKPTAEQLVEATKREVEAKIEALKKDQLDLVAKAQKDAEERAQKALKDEEEKVKIEKEQIIIDFRNDLGQFIQKNSEKYELMNLHDKQGNLAFTIIEEQFIATGKVLSFSEASDLAEKWYDDRVQESLATKKYKAKGSVPSSEKEEAAKKEHKTATQEVTNATKTPSLPQQTKTINHSMTSTSPSSVSSKSEQDRISRALAALNKA